VTTINPRANAFAFTVALDKPVKGFVSLLKEKTKTAMLPLVILACSAITVSLQVVLRTQATCFTEEGKPHILLSGPGFVLLKRQLLSSFK